jgi:hypothetical protein
LTSSPFCPDADNVWWLVFVPMIFVPYQVILLSIIHLILKFCIMVWFFTLLNILHTCIPLPYDKKFKSDSHQFHQVSTKWTLMFHLNSLS